jgi:seryl-tRNA synthetase
MQNVIDLPTPMPSELKADFVGRLHYISEDLESFFVDSQCVRFATRPGREGSAELIGARIREVAGIMCDGRRVVPPRILFARRSGSYPYQENPRARLEADGNLFAYGPGRFGIGPLLVRLEASFQMGLLRLADQLGAMPHRFPVLIGADVLERCRYIQSFPQHLSLVSHLRDDLDAIRQFAKSAEVEEGRLKYPAETTAAPECLLASTVCFHYYAWLRDRRLDGPRTITALGHCFRHEFGNMTELERLWDFMMREVVFVGKPDYVISQRDRAIELTKALLEEWDLGYDIQSATDPFFIEGYSAHVAFQSAFELKFEIRADLPYQPGKTLAIGSFNFHQDFFGRSLGITNADGEPACTGCVGFGIERLVWAFLAQHGPDPECWPAPTRKAVLQ